MNPVDKFASRVGRIKPSATLEVGAKAAKLRAQGEDIISLNAGEPDFPTPPHICEAAIKAIEAGQTKYTLVSGTQQLRDAVCMKLAKENSLDYLPEEVVVSCGAKHSIINVLMCLVDKNDEVIIISPYWVSYPDMVEFCGGTPVYLETSADDNFVPDVDKLAQLCNDKTRAIIINSPSNPCGVVFSEDTLRQIAQVLANYPQIAVISDDIYEHILYSGNKFLNLLNVDPSLRDRFILINGVSKAYAMTGWRIGYLAADKQLVAQVNKVQSQMTSGACSIAQAAACAALTGGTECIAPMLLAFDRRRQLIENLCSQTELLSCPPIQGAFYAMIDARRAIDKLFAEGKISASNDLALASYWLEHAKVAAVPGTSFGQPNFLRISFATSDEVISEAFSRITTTMAS